VYQEARKWYKLYGSEDKIAWSIGHGGHGTPQEVRERIYAWFILWLMNGKGDPAEQKVDLHPDYELWATETGQVSTALRGRDIDQVIQEEFTRLRRPGTPAELMETLRRWSPPVPDKLASPRVLNETLAEGLITRKLAIETEPGLELEAALLVPRSEGAKPGILVVETSAAPSPLARRIAERGNVVLSLLPRGKPGPSDYYRQLVGDWLPNTRAWLVGLNMPGLRAQDIRRGLDVLAAQAGVDASRIEGVAREVSGVWLLMAAALDQRISGIWLDRTPYSLRAALGAPLQRNLHDAVLPGFALRWDLDDLVKAIEPRRVVWTDPTDWMGSVKPLGPLYRYRPSEAPDDPYLDELLR
jgi:hypothetical protein